MKHPIHGKDPNSYQKILIHPIEKDKKGREDRYANFKYSEHPEFFAALASYLKKAMNSLVIKGKEHSYLVRENHLAESLSSFRSLLVLLATKDVSHDPEFTQKLSERWHCVIDDLHSLTYFFTKKNPELLSKIQFFIDQVDHYPPSGDHSLGYYFSQYAGKKWIPFPFMELLQTLHKQSIKLPKTNTLRNWLFLIDEILSSRH